MYSCYSLLDLKSTEVLYARKCYMIEGEYHEFGDLFDVCYLEKNSVSFCKSESKVLMGKERPTCHSCINVKVNNLEKTSKMYNGEEKVR